MFDFRHNIFLDFLCFEKLTNKQLSSQQPPLHLVICIQRGSKELKGLAAMPNMLLLWFWELNLNTTLKSIPRNIKMNAFSKAQHMLGRSSKQATSSSQTN